MNISWPSQEVKALWESGAFSRGATEPWTAQVVAALAAGIGSGDVIETGTFLGTTTSFLADIKPKSLRTVDISVAAGRIGDLQCEYVLSDALAFLSSLPRESVDFAFIDDDHDAKHVDTEVALLLPAMRKGGIVCLHDVIGPFGLDAIVKKYDGYCLDLPRIHVAGGLGIIQV